MGAFTEIQLQWVGDPSQNQNISLGSNTLNSYCLRYQKIAKSQWHWRVQGGARDEKFIQQLEKEGVKLRRTGRGSVACKVNTHKELIYIDEMMDDTDVEEFRKAPSWKRVCVTILKNDTKCLYMGFSRTKSDLEKRKTAIQKYKEIL